MSATADLTLYGDAFWISPYVFSCFVALREKGLPFAVVEVSLADGEQGRDQRVALRKLVDRRRRPHVHAAPASAE
jgi:glutathione S-transferase